MVENTAQATPKPVCVIVDTSVWRAEPLLKSPMGRTLVYTITRRSAVLGLPEVIELELKKQIVEAGLEAVAKARASLQILSTLTWNPTLLAMLPTAEILGNLVDEQLTKLALFTIRVPFTLEHAKAALTMVNRKLPPNGDKDQQFKDSAVWQAVLELLPRYSVALLTLDKAFFLDRDPRKGLATNLIADCDRIGSSVTAYPGITPYLESLKDDAPEFDQTRVTEGVLPEALERLKAEAMRSGLTPSKLQSARVIGFKTDAPGRVAVDYTLKFGLAALADAAPIDPELRGFVHGSVYLTMGDSLLTDHYIQSIKVVNRNGFTGRDFRDYDSAFPIPRPIDLEGT